MLKELFPGSTDFTGGYNQNTPKIKTFIGYANKTEMIELRIVQERDKLDFHRNNNTPVIK